MEYSSKDNNDLSDFGAEYIRAIGEELKCRICLLHLRDPQVANCSHSFCKQCIQKGFETMPKSKREKNSWSCPLCKAPFNRRAIKSDEVTNNLVTEFFNLARSFENLHQRNDMFSQEQPYEDSPIVVAPTDNKEASITHTTLDSLDLNSRSLKNDSSKTLVNSESSGLKTISGLSEIGQTVPETTLLSTSKPEKQKTFEKESETHDLSEGLPNLSSLFKSPSPETINLTSISPKDFTFKSNNTQQKELADLLFPEDSSEEASTPNLLVKPIIKKAHHKKETSYTYLRNSHPSSGIGVIQVIRNKKILKILKKQKLNPKNQQCDFSKTPRESHDYDRILDSSPSPSINNSPKFSNLSSNVLFPNCVSDIRNFHESQNINSSKGTSFNSSLIINPIISKPPQKDTPFYNDLMSKTSMKEKSILASQCGSKNSDLSYSSIELLRKEDTISSIELNDSPSKVNNTILDFSSESSPICNKLINNLNRNDGLLRESDLSASSDINNFLFKKPSSNEFPNREDSIGLITETMNLDISKTNYPPPNQLALFDSSWSQIDDTQTSRIFNDSKVLQDNTSPTQVLNHTQPMITQLYDNSQPLLQGFGIDNCFSPKNKEKSGLDINILSSRNNSDLTSGYCESSLKFAGTPFSQTRLDIIKRPARFILDEELNDSRNYSQHVDSNFERPKDYAYLDKDFLKHTDGKDFLGTPFFTPVQVRRNSHSIIYDSELEESSESLKNTSFDIKESIQNDSSHVFNDSCSSKQDETNNFICGTPFSDYLKKEFKVKPNIILDEELLNNGSCSSSLQRFSSS